MYMHVWLSAQVLSLDPPEFRYLVIPSDPVSVGYGLVHNRYLQQRATVFRIQFVVAKTSYTPSLALYAAGATFAQTARHARRNCS
jgi:hypothetical protein